MTLDWRAITRLEANQRLVHTSQEKTGHLWISKDVGG